jgi:hypothetical protein
MGIRRRTIWPQQPNIVTGVVKLDAGRLTEEYQECTGLNPRACGDDVRSGTAIADVIQHPPAQVYGHITEAKNLDPFILIVGRAVAIPVHISRRGQELVEHDGGGLSAQNSRKKQWTYHKRKANGQS